TTIRDLPYREAWVMRVITNVALKVLRRGAAPLLTASAASEADGAASRVTLVAGLQELPARQREVIGLHHLLGWRGHEVAVQLGIAPSTVKTHLKRGMVALRQDLGAVATAS